MVSPTISSTRSEDETTGAAREEQIPRAASLFGHNGTWPDRIPSYLKTAKEHAGRQ
jgi:hypothetical protein